MILERKKLVRNKLHERLSLYPPTHLFGTKINHQCDWWLLICCCCSVENNVHFKRENGVYSAARADRGQNIKKETQFRYRTISFHITEMS